MWRLVPHKADFLNLLLYWATTIIPQLLKTSVTLSHWVHVPSLQWKQNALEHLMCINVGLKIVPTNTLFTHIWVHYSFQLFKYISEPFWKCHNIYLYILCVTSTVFIKFVFTDPAPALVAKQPAHRESPHASRLATQGQVSSLTLLKKNSACCSWLTWNKTFSPLNFKVHMGPNLADHICNVLKLMWKYFSPFK